MADTPMAISRAVTHLVDQQVAAEKAGQGTVTVGTGDLKLLLRTFATLFRHEVTAAGAARREEAKAHA